MNDFNKMFAKRFYKRYGCVLRYLKGYVYIYIYTSKSFDNIENFS